MTTYLVNLVIVYIASLFARINIKTNTLQNDHKYYNNIFIMIAWLSMTLVAGLRYYVGTDYNAYKFMYNNSPNILIDNETSEVGFLLLCKLLNKITSDAQIMFLLTSIIIYTCIVITLKRKSKIFELSMYLFITSYMYYSSMNILRQWIASSIIFLGIDYLINRDWKRYFLIVIIASLFHTSAVIMIFVYFIINHKFISKKTLLMILIFMVIFMSYDTFLTGFFEILEFTKYSSYQDEFINIDRGVNILRVLVYIIPIAITVIFYKGIKLNSSKDIDVIMNLSLINMILMIFGIKHAYFARLCVFFEPYYLLLIPSFVNISDKRMNRIIYYLIIVLYFIFSYSLLVSGDGEVLHYQWKLPII